MKVPQIPLRDRTIADRPDALFRENAVHVWDRHLIAKYEVVDKRCTSYPCPCRFDDSYDGDFYSQEAVKNSRQSIAPLSLRVHVPFCLHNGDRCDSQKIITSDHAVIRTYLDYLSKEIQIQSKLMSKHRTILKLHLDGGAPALLNGAELTELMHQLASHYNLTDCERREYSIELDPSTVTRDDLALFKGLGFNQLAIEIQDFNRQVQRAVNRHQEFGVIKTFMEVARLYEFKSISYDLIYGLPFQTFASLETTLDNIVELSPDRIFFCRYVHSPQHIKNQRQVDQQNLPSTDEKITMLTLIGDKLTAAGYQHLGMDCFVKPEDDLAVAQRDGMLQINLQGYSTCSVPDLVSLGVAAISLLHDTYFQNECHLDNYYRRLCEDRLSVAKGIKLDDGRLLQTVIMQITCALLLDMEAIEKQFNVKFSDYFSRELSVLKGMEGDGLLFKDNAKLKVSKQGKLLIREICLPFEQHLQLNSMGDEPKTQ